jgi:hypothetical protein
LQALRQQQDLEAAAKASQAPYQNLTNNQFSKWVFKKGNKDLCSCVPTYILLLFSRRQMTPQSF